MIQEIAYAGWSRNLQIRGNELNLIITLEVGPRILHASLGERTNVMGHIQPQLGGAAETEWSIRGGHRFWTAPEADHSYELDNVPVTHEITGESSVEITQPAGPFGFQKRMRVEVLEGDLVKITHFLTNVCDKPLDITPWTLTVLAPGGSALIPQPKLDVHPSEFPKDRKVQPSDFWPNREMVLWPFTNLTDGRYSFSTDFLRLKYQNGLPATKIGLKLPTGWVAYENNGTIFAKHFARDNALPYPDMGVNCEIFTNPDIFEVESLAPALPLLPGATREHVEHWFLKAQDAAYTDEQGLAFFAGLPTIGS